MTDRDIDSYKKQLRCQMRLQRQVLSASWRRYAAQNIAKQADNLLKRGQRIAVYRAYGSELDLLPLIKRALLKKVQLYLPQVPKWGRQLQFVPYSAKQLLLHPFAKSVQRIYPFKRARQLDILFVPLLAVDHQGYRLGQGGGFYDASLKFRQFHRLAQKPIVIGVSFTCQCIQHVPHTNWDIPLDGLITELKVTWFTTI